MRLSRVPFRLGGLEKSSPYLFISYRSSRNLPLVGGVLLLELCLGYLFVYVGATMAVLSPIGEVSMPPFTPLEV